MSTRNSNLVEGVVRGLVNNGMSAKDIMTGVYDSFAFASLLYENGFEIDSQDFRDFMDNLKEAVVLSKRFKR